MDKLGWKFINPQSVYSFKILSYFQETTLYSVVWKNIQIISNIYVFGSSCWLYVWPELLNNQLRCTKYVNEPIDNARSKKEPLQVLYK